MNPTAQQYFWVCILTFLGSLFLGSSGGLIKRRDITCGFRAGKSLGQSRKHWKAQNRFFGLRGPLGNPWVRNRGGWANYRHRRTAAFLRTLAHQTDSHRNMKAGILFSSFVLRPASPSSTELLKNPPPPIGQIMRPRPKKPFGAQNTTNKAKGRQPLHLKTRSEIKLEDLYFLIYIP